MKANVGIKKDSSSSLSRLRNGEDGLRGAPGIVFPVIAFADGFVLIQMPRPTSFSSLRWKDRDTMEERPWGTVLAADEVADQPPVESVHCFFSFGIMSILY
jgi:hypothetical protein